MKRDEIVKRYEDGECKNMNQLYNWIKQMKLEFFTPNKFKKGDVFWIKKDQKSRPYVLFCEIKGNYVLIPLTTTKDSLSTGNYNSRFFGKGYFSKSLITLHMGLLKDNFVGVFDDSRSLNKAVKDIKKHFMSI